MSAYQQHIISMDILDCRVGGEPVMRAYTPISSDDDLGIFDLVIKVKIPPPLVIKVKIPPPLVIKVKIPPPPCHQGQNTPPPSPRGVFLLISCQAQ